MGVRHRGGHAAGCRAIEGLNGLIFGAHDVEFFQRFAHGFAVHGGQIAMQQAGPIQFAQQAHYATGTVHIFHMINLCAGCYFGQMRHFAR